MKDEVNSATVSSVTEIIWDPRMPCQSMYQADLSRARLFRLCMLSIFIHSDSAAVRAKVLRGPSSPVTRFA